LYLGAPDPRLGHAGLRRRASRRWTAYWRESTSERGNGTV
jgi:hypothetical protein